MTCDYGTLREDRTAFSTLTPYRNAGFERATSTASFEAFGLEHEITAHRFFGFRERSVEDEPSVRARDHPALAAEWLGAFDLAAFIQSLEPRHHFVHSMLQLVRGKTSVPMRSPEKQDVFTCRCFCIHNYTTNQLSQLGQFFSRTFRLIGGLTPSAGTFRILQSQDPFDPTAARLM